MKCWQVGRPHGAYGPWIFLTALGALGKWKGGLGWGRVWAKVWEKQQDRRGGITNSWVSRKQKEGKEGEDNKRLAEVLLL